MAVNRQVHHRYAASASICFSIISNGVLNNNTFLGLLLNETKFTLSLSPLINLKSVDFANLGVKGH